MSTGVKIVVYSVVGIAVISAGYLMIKNAKIVRETNLAESEGYKCSGCKDGIKVCKKDGAENMIVNCSYKLIS